MFSGHILGHLLWQSGLHQRPGLLLIRCLCKCPPWAWPRLFLPHAALGQIHLCFPHSSYLPGHGSTCSSADRPHELSRACVRVGSWWENRHPQMCSQSVLFNVAWEQAPEHMLLEGGVRVPTDILLVHRALQLSKGVSLPCVRPRTCVSNIWLETLTPRAYL